MTTRRESAARMGGSLDSDAVAGVVDGFRRVGGAVAPGWSPRQGFLYTVVRAISARINQNWDGWPSDELRRAAHTFVGKPVFVNHQNSDPSKARGVVVAARYVEAGDDKYVEVVQEVDAQRFPKLAHEIRSGGLDSVSMGAEAGHTICSACGNRAVDVPDFCDHVRHHKGRVVRGRDGKDVLVYEECRDIRFFELSYVFDPADETAVASKVLVASRRTGAYRDGEPHPSYKVDDAGRWYLPDDCPGCGAFAHHDGCDWQGNHRAVVMQHNDEVDGRRPREETFDGWAADKPASWDEETLRHQWVEHQVDGAHRRRQGSERSRREWERYLEDRETERRLSDTSQYFDPKPREGRRTASEHEFEAAQSRETARRLVRQHGSPEAALEAAGGDELAARGLLEMLGRGKWTDYGWYDPSFKMGGRARWEELAGWAPRRRQGAYRYDPSDPVIHSDPRFQHYPTDFHRPVDDDDEDEREWQCRGCGRDDNTDATCDDCGGPGPSGPADRRHEFRDARLAAGWESAVDRLEGPYGPVEDDPEFPRRRDDGPDWESVVDDLERRHVAGWGGEAIRNHDLYGPQGLWQYMSPEDRDRAYGQQAGEEALDERDQRAGKPKVPSWFRDSRTAGGKSVSTGDTGVAGAGGGGAPTPSVYGTPYQDVVTSQGGSMSNPQDVAEVLQLSDNITQSGQYGSDPAAMPNRGTLPDNLSQGLGNMVQGPGGDRDAAPSRSAVGRDGWVPSQSWPGGAKPPGDYDGGTDYPFFTPTNPLSAYVAPAGGTTGPGASMTPTKFQSAVATAGAILARRDMLRRTAALQSAGGRRMDRLGYGQTEAPEAVDTLRDDSLDDGIDDFQWYIEPPADLRGPDVDEAKRLDREQDEGLEAERRELEDAGGDPAAQLSQGGPAMMEIRLPMPDSGLSGKYPPQGYQVAGKAAPRLVNDFNRWWAGTKGGDLGDMPAWGDLAVFDESYRGGRGLSDDEFNALEDHLGVAHPPVQKLDMSAPGGQYTYTYPTQERRDRERTAKGGCTCWKGYERVPGTEPCASGSCRKRAGRRFSATLEDLAYELGTTPKVLDGMADLGLGPDDELSAEDERYVRDVWAEEAGMSRRARRRTAATCPECDGPCEVVGEGYGYEEQYKVYPVSDCCGADMDEEDGPDPDAAYDAWRDDQMDADDYREGRRRTAGDGPGTIDDMMLRSMGLDPKGNPIGGGGGGGYYGEDMQDEHGDCRECGDSIINGEWTDGWTHVTGDHDHQGTPITTELDHPAAPDYDDYDDEGSYIDRRHIRWKKEQGRPLTPQEESYIREGRRRTAAGDCSECGTPMEDYTEFPGRGGDDSRPRCMACYEKDPEVQAVTRNMDADTLSRMWGGGPRRRSSRQRRASDEDDYQREHEQNLARGREHREWLDSLSPADRAEYLRPVSDEDRDKAFTEAGGVIHHVPIRGRESRRRWADRHRAPEGIDPNDGDWDGSIYNDRMWQMLEDGGIEPDGRNYRKHVDRHGIDEDTDPNDEFGGYVNWAKFRGDEPSEEGLRRWQKLVQSNRRRAGKMSGDEYMALLQQRMDDYVAKNPPGGKVKKWAEQPLLEWFVQEGDEDLVDLDRTARRRLAGGPMRGGTVSGRRSRTNERRKDFPMSLAARNRVASNGRMRHFADESRNDQGVQEPAFISQTPPAEEVVAPTGDESKITNTESNLVARVQRGTAQLQRDASALARLRQTRRRRRQAADGAESADLLNPELSGTDDQALKGEFEALQPEQVATQPKDASLKVFQAFDGWLRRTSGRSARQLHTKALTRQAARFCRATGTPPRAMYPAMGYALREARKIEAVNRGRSAMNRRRTAVDLPAAAPDGRVDVEAPVSNTTDDAAQASQYAVSDYGQNAGDSVAAPDLTTDSQIWAPGEKQSRKADGVLAVRCAEAYIKAGLEPEESRWKLAALFQTMNRGAVQRDIALLERVGSMRAEDAARAARRTPGTSRGATRGFPVGLGGAPRTAGAARVASSDPVNDAALWV